MNIIKFKDIILDSTNAPGLTDEQRENFNTKYRDRFVYSVNWKYIAALEDIDNTAFTELSKVLCTEYDEAANNILPFDKVILFDDYKEYLDAAVSEKANSVVKYREANKFSSDSDITLDEIKLFRTWLAETLYNIIKDTAEYDTLEMLGYYKNEMNDDTIKHLTHFVPSPVNILNTTVKNTCGCAGTANTSGISAFGTVNTCDPVYIYRKGVYEKMVSVFSDINFWTDKEIEFLSEFKKYIDTIIEKNLPLVQSDYVTGLYDCNCLAEEDSAQARLIGMLKNLSSSLNYMVTEDINGHKNFIGDSFNQWAAYLYENMRWY